MNEELLPVEASEFVYRRIHRSFLDPALELPVQPAAFRPNENDKTGLCPSFALGLFNLLGHWRMFATRNEPNTLLHESRSNN